VGYHRSFETRRHFLSKIRLRKQELILRTEQVYYLCGKLGGKYFGTVSFSLQLTGSRIKSL
jgi:hypothetical protein